MLDQSPAVRDAALELLSRYVAYNAKLASQYLPRILLRVAVSASVVLGRLPADFCIAGRRPQCAQTGHQDAAIAVSDTQEQRGANRHLQASRWPHP